MTACNDLRHRILGIVDSSPICEAGEKIRINNRLAFFLQRVAPEFRKVVLCAPVVGKGSAQFASRTSSIGAANVVVVRLPDADHFGQGVLVRRALTDVDFAWLFHGHAAMVYHMAHFVHSNRPFGLQVEGNPIDLAVMNFPRSPVACIYRRAAGLVEKSMARRANLIMAVGKELSSRFIEMGGSAKVYTISPFIDLGSVAESDRCDTCGNPDEIICLFVGRVSYPKGCQHLLEAIDLLRRRGHPVRACMVGDGEYLPELRRHAAKLGILEHVVFTGHLAPGPDLWAQYKQADMFVLPSYSEGLPKVLYEASALGLPLITTSVGGISGVFSHEESALFVEAGSAEAVADAVVRLISEPRLRRRLITNGRQIAIRAREESKTFGKRFVSLLVKHVPSLASAT